MSLPAVLDAFHSAPGRSTNHRLQMSALELQAASDCPSHLFHASVQAIPPWMGDKADPQGC